MCLFILLIIVLKVSYSSATNAEVSWSKATLFSSQSLTRKCGLTFILGARIFNTTVT